MAKKTVGVPELRFVIETQRAMIEALQETIKGLNDVIATLRTPVNVMGGESTTLSEKENAADLESRLRKAVESAVRDQKEGEFQTVQGEIDGQATKAVTAYFEPFREGAEELLRILRYSFAQVARFIQGDFRKEPSFYLGQLYLLAEIADKLRQRRLPKDVIELVASSSRAVEVLQHVSSLGSVGASELADKLGMHESNLSALCSRLVDHEVMRADRYGQRVRYSPTPLTHATNTTEATGGYCTAYNTSGTHEIC